MDWLAVERGDAPLLVCFPHGGQEIPAALEAGFVSPWLARKDADWSIARIYAGARALGATTIATGISRSVIDCNRDPSGRSLYPGQATTELCPTTSFDGEPLYRADPPDAAEIARRRAAFFDPYHAAIAAELARLRQAHPRVILYDAHSIRSRVPRLFEGRLPLFNVGTNGGASCDPALRDAVARICAESGRSHVVDGRFKGGWTTRHYGRPDRGIHALQMELAMRAYLDEPDLPDPHNWPAPPDPGRAGPLMEQLTKILTACLAFARS